jgi:branched-chain amino acid transport system substrate-binding protein
MNGSRLLFAANLLSLFALAACRRPSEPAVIGFALPKSADAVAAVAADTLASDRTDPPIRVIVDWGSGGSESQAEAARAQRLVSVPGLVGVVGHAGSRGSLVAAPVYVAAGVPLIVPTATSRRLRDLGPWVFMLAPNDSLEGAFIGAFGAERLGARRFAIFYVNDEYGAGIRDGLKEWTRGSVASLVDEVPYVDGSDLGTLLSASLARGKPDLLVVAGRPNEAALLARLVSGLEHPIPVIGADGTFDQLRLFRDLAGPIADSVYFVSFWLPDSADAAGRAYLSRYRKLNHAEASVAEAMHYDAVMLLARAVREVGSDRRRIRDWLTSLGASRPGYRGVTGDISFASHRPHRLRMVRLRGDSIVAADQP